MSRRLMLRNESGTTPILPPEYQQVEWIGFGQYCYLYLGVIDWASPGFDIDLLMPSWYPNQYGPFVISGKADNYIVFAPIAEATNFRIKGAETSVDAILPLNTRNRVTVKNMVGNVLGESYNLQTGSATSGYLYVGLYGGTVNDRRYMFSGKIFSLDFYDGNSRTIGLIPCYRKSDGAIGMYDTISQTFFTNGGTGTFTKGADV